VANQEPLFATASLVRSWVLLEQSGPWGLDALRQSDVPDAVAASLHDLSVRRDVRVLLIRRPGLEDGQRCYVAHSAGPDPWVEERTLSGASDLLGLDWEAVAEGRRPGFGVLRTDPLYLVCTNSRHDACCGRLGRPTARALADAVGGWAWECSHMGGERFAANMICLPHGLYFGRLDPRSAPEVAALHQHGQIDLDHYRGRAGDPFLVQAAEFFARRQLELRGIDDLLYESRRALGVDMVEVGFSRPRGASITVRVARAPDPQPRALTCHSPVLSSPWTYWLLGMSEG
jgi:hypothetical protein